MASLPCILGLTGCSTVPLKEAGTLSSYERLGPPKGTLTKSRTFVNPQALATIRTASVQPSRLSFTAASRIRSTEDRALVTNALNRAICVALSDKYKMVPIGQPADLIVRTEITDVVLTNKTMAGVSTAVSLGSNLVLPVGIPRLPLGLGGLAVEGEAVDSTGNQLAAIVWSRGANSITNNARVSEVVAASKCAFGTVIEITRDACFNAMRNRRSDVSVNDFAEAYFQRSACTKANNVFTARRWEAIDPKKVFAS